MTKATEQQLNKLPKWAQRIIAGVMANEAEFGRPLPGNSFYKLAATRLLTTAR